MNSYFKEKLLPHLLAVVLFTVLTFAYLSPLLSGDRLLQHDYVQAMGQQHEITTYVHETGKQTLWTNSMFSGMPSVQIWLEYPGNLLGQALLMVQDLYIHEAHLLFLLMLGVYVLGYSLTRNSMLAIVGAIAFAFGSFNLISIQAGHLNKVLAITFIAPILGGLVVAYRGRLITGAAIFAIFLTLQLRSNHFQITYYTIIACSFLAIYALIESILKKEMPLFAKATAMLGFAAMLAFMANTTQLWGTWEYSKATIRGGNSELTSKKTDMPGGGLDTSYAFSYSEGIDEVLTIMIPNFKGGGQFQSYSGTGLYDKTTEMVVNQRHVTQAAAEKMVDQNYKGVYYYGGGGFTAGPIYFGAITCFLFILGLFIIRSNIKWALLAIAIFSVFLAWGKNFSSLNYFLFYHLPMFNKFRTPSMNLTMTNVAFVFMAILALKELTDNGYTKDDLIKRVKYAAGTTIGILVLFGLIGSFFYSYNGSPDVEEQLSKADILGDVLADRKSLLQMDTLRSIVFVLLGIGLVWTFVTQKIKLKQNYFFAALGLLILVDLWSVDKRCFNDEKFVTEAEYNKNFKPSAADQSILRDKEDYRVLDMTTGDPFTNAMTSYFHHSLGGYHAAKLRIYQELIESQIGANINNLSSALKQNRMPDNIPVLNMLNTRYFMFGKTEEQVLRNPGALGNAWFVQDIKYVPTADEEMASLTGFDPKKTAIVRNTFKDQLGAFMPGAPDSTAKIELTNYIPDHLTYRSNSPKQELAVFSEIYYKDGKDWKVTIDDGKEIPHLRADYVLRALVIPAGSHKIDFRFEPAFYSKGNIISLIGSLLIIALIGYAIYEGYKGSNKTA